MRMDICPPPALFYDRRYRFTLNASGVTLIELLVTIALVALLISISASYLSGFLHLVRVHNATNSLFEALMLARSEAIKSNSRVVLCKSSDGLQCSKDGSWSQGWLIFHDANNNIQVDSGENIVSTMPSFNKALLFVGNTNVARYISFTPQGRTKLASGAFQAGTFTICAASAEYSSGRQIVIGSTGYVRITKLKVERCIQP